MIDNNRGIVNNFYSVRGGAALVVFISHAPILNHPSLGAVAVWVFFVLSGFLLYLFYENLTIKDFWIRTPTFWWRRFFRIIPAYFFYLVCYAIFYYFKFNVSYLNWLENHLLFKIADGHFWSIKLEVLFYILFPFSIFLLFYFKVWSRFYIALLITVAALFLIENNSKLYINAAGINLEIYLTPFLLGTSLAIIRNKIPISFFNWFFCIGFIGLVYLSFDYDFIKNLRAWLNLPSNDNIGWRYSSMTYPFCGLLVLGAYKANNLLLNNKIIIFIGKISFSFYLSHLLCLYLVDIYVDQRFLVTLIALLLTVVLSYLTYYFIETKAINFSKQFDLAISILKNK